MYQVAKSMKVRPEDQNDYEVEEYYDDSEMSLGKRLAKYFNHLSLKRGVRTSLERLPVGDYYILPKNRYYRIWWTFVVIAATYSSLLTPLEFGFYRGLPRSWWIADLCTQIIFIADIFVNFFVAYRDPVTFKLVVNHRSIARRYIKSDFIFDVLACLPWDTIYKGTGRHEFVRYFLWIRLYRVRKPNEFFEKLEKDIRFSYFGVRIAKLLAVEFYCTHTSACIFYYLATTVPESREDYTWIGSLQLGSSSYDNFRDIDIGKRYVTSLYWAIITMATVGYGDIHAVNTREMIFVMIFVSFDMILGAYLVGNMTALIVKGSNTERFRDKMTSLIKFMNRNNLPQDIRDQMKDHVRLEFESGTLTEMNVVEHLPMTIRSRVSQSMFGSIVERVPLFGGCSKEFLNEIVSNVSEEYFLPGDIVIHQGAASDQFYIVSHGELEEVLVGEDGSEEIVSQLKGNSLCGEVGVMCNIPQPFTVRVSDLCRLLRIDKDSFTHIVQIYFNDGRKLITNLLECNQTDARCGQLGSDVSFLIAKQQAELALMINNAAFQGDIAQLKHLVKAGAVAIQADYDGRTPLHLAASKGYDVVVRFLIREGADVNAVDKFGSTPLFEAVKAGQDHTVTLLCENGAALHLENEGSFLCETVMSGNSEFLRRLIEAGVDVSKTDYDNRTALHLAASEGSVTMTKLLLEAGASVLARDRWGRTPVDEAVLHNRTNVITLLKESAVNQPHVQEALPELTSTLRRRPTAAVKVTDGEETHEVTKKNKYISPRLSVSSDLSTDPEHHPAMEKRLERLVTLGVGVPHRKSNASEPHEDAAARYRRFPARRGGPNATYYDPSPARFDTLPRRRCTIFPYHPWTPRSASSIGKVEWVGPSIRDIMDVAYHEFGKVGSKVLNQDGGEITDTDLIGDSEKVFVVDENDLVDDGSPRGGRSNVLETNDR